ncbi:MAG: hypothetical protein K940chlam2_00277 [Chlamydiae bacterium]|nr:hypothetical protein [Chlamydiota bacterium]
MATEVNPAQNGISPVKQSGYTAAQILGSALTGAMAGHFFSIVTPGGGALFGTVQGLANALLGPVLDKIFDSDSTLGKIAKVAVQIFASIAIAVGAVAIAGVSLTLTAGLYLSLAMIPVSIITSVLFGVIQNDKQA